MTEQEIKAHLTTLSENMIRSPIRTERILIRPFEKTDLMDFYAYRRQTEQQRLSGNDPIRTPEEARESLDWILRPDIPTTCFALEYLAERRVIGNLSICIYPFIAADKTLDGQKGVSLSFILNEDYWRQGIMTEVLRAAIDWFFTDGNLDFVNAGYFAFNEGSRRLQEKVGMRHYMDHVYEYRGEKIPTKEMILFRSEYDARKNAFHKPDHNE